jgi:hypothetical protein
MGIHEEFCEGIYVVLSSKEAEAGNALMLIEETTEGFYIKRFSFIFP